MILTLGAKTHFFGSLHLLLNLIPYFTAFPGNGYFFFVFLLYSKSYRQIQMTAYNNVNHNNWCTNMFWLEASRYCSTKKTLPSTLIYSSFMLLYSSTFTSSSGAFFSYISIVFCYRCFLLFNWHQFYYSGFTIYSFVILRFIFVFLILPFTWQDKYT